MISFIKKIISLILYNGGIYYEKINTLPKETKGYNNLNKVLERYSDSTYLVTSPMRDVEYFLKDECTDIRKDLKQISTLLDVGCGNGSYSVFFNKLNLFSRKLKYYGIEIDKDFVEFCQRKFPNHIFKVSKAESIEYKSNLFDMVFCSGTLHYTLNNWKKSLREISRVSKKYILISRIPITKHNESFFVHQTVLSRISTENHYFKVISKSEFENYIKMLGLKIHKKDYSSEIYFINGIKESIVLSNYLLVKNI